MNCFIVCSMMLASLSWMMVVLEYQVYHRLTVKALIQKAKKEYLLDMAQLKANRENAGE